MPPEDAHDRSPGWRPDPTDRHDYRWWTGVDWSDQVGDRGAVSIDPGPVPRPKHPAASEDVLRRRRRVGAVAVAGALVVASAGAAAKVVSGRPSTGLGVHVVDIDPTTALGSQVLRLRAGDVVRLRAEPSTRVKVAVHVTTDGPTARAAAVAMAEGSGDEPDALARRIFRDADDVVADEDAAGELATTVVLATIDTAGPGRADADYYVAPVDGDYRILVEVRATRDLGPVRLVAERFPTRYVESDPGAATFFDDPFFTEAAFYRGASAYDSAG